ncbi:MAG TPA: glucosamine-6-phosphate deaminase, partial [Clostridiaceae bacterium]|nr:glucosamine-6-phosphate deaminase [Clostridiaceae bacterium]
MRLIITKNYEDMSRKAANMLAAQVLLKPNSILGLATGSTPIQTYKNLISMYENGDVDFSKVTSFNLDEYVNLP